ncbi:MAG: paraquat-inducible protein A [Verrucomicrobiales bacterium]|nr:paraquat-inducible protein A [Verrucomicrobiales bacterium]
MGDSKIVACLDCDLLQRIPDVPTGASVRCPRCDKELWRHKPDSLNRTFALTLAALVLYIIANAVPMLGLHAVGREAFTTVIGGAQQLWHDGQQIVAVLVLFAAVISPALQIIFLLLIVTGCQRERPPFWVGLFLRNLHFTRTWSMIEVMLLGVLVALTKIADYAHVILGTALFALFGLVFLLAMIQSSFDPREVWSRIEWAEEEAHSPETAGPVTGVTP